jgi:hypothetical protein
MWEVVDFAELDNGEDARLLPAETNTAPVRCFTLLPLLPWPRLVNWLSASGLSVMYACLFV